MVLSSFFAVCFSAAASSCFLWVLIPSLRRCFLDQPNERSSHYQPTPSGGGVAFVLVASIASLLELLFGSSSASASLPMVAAALLAMPLALIGFLDDRHNLPATLRYCVQLITASVVILVSPLVTSSFGLSPLLALLLIAVTAVINFTNFMDGLDGLVAGCMAVMMTTTAIHLTSPLPIWSLVGSLLGFLLLNWSPSKVFMGDVGSTFLGSVFVLLVLQAPNWSDAFALLLLATPLLGDACLCVMRRLHARQNVFKAHRLHLFQRLHQAGWPHARVSSLYIAATVVLSIAHLLKGLPLVTIIATFELLLGIWLDQKVAIPFAVAKRN